MVNSDEIKAVKNHILFIAFRSRKHDFKFPLRFSRGVLVQHKFDRTLLSASVGTDEVYDKLVELAFESSEARKLTCSTIASYFSSSTFLFV